MGLFTKDIDSKQAERRTDAKTKRIEENSEKKRLKNKEKDVAIEQSKKRGYKHFKAEVAFNKKSKAAHGKRK